jgi:hypothetical protein
MSIPTDRRRELPPDPSLSCEWDSRRDAAGGISSVSPLSESVLPLAGLRAWGVSVIAKFVMESGSAYTGVEVPVPVDAGREVVDLELAGVLIWSEPGAEGVQNRAKDAIARKSPRAGVVIEKSGRSWHVPSYTWRCTFVGPYLSSIPTREGSCWRVSSRIGYFEGLAAL